MPYESFYERFKELALKETRSISVQNNPDLPEDEFAFFEAYCADKNCDCRRVMFNVMSRRLGKAVAVIAYGWESKEFYARWYRSDDKSIAREMQGPSLNGASQQSELAPALLELVRNQLLQDPAYIERLKRHYQIFKEKVDPVHFKAPGSSRFEMDPVGKSRKRHRPRA